LPIEIATFSSLEGGNLSPRLIAIVPFIVSKMLGERKPYQNLRSTPYIREMTPHSHVTA